MGYDGKHILVLGAGESGIGAASVLARCKAHVILNDYQSIALAPAVQAKMDELGVAVITGRQDNDLLEHIDEIVISPGIKPSIPIVKEAQLRNIPVVGEVEVAYRLCKAPMLGVTGTNGKTTTTTLLGDVCKAWYHHVSVGGNIGDSLSEVAFTEPADGVVVAELSSYQLETIQSFRPKGAIILNITPDHLARHGTMEAYRAAKARIFENQTSEDFVVLNADDPLVSSLVTQVHSQLLLISQHNTVQNGAYYQDSTLFAVKEGIATAIINRNEIALPGNHNVENVLAVIALSYALGVSPQVLHDVIAQFHAVEHRLEPVLTYQDVTFYNDSKATNVDSVVKALESFTEPVVLLLGGHDKHTPLEDFMAFAKDKVSAMVMMGEAQQRFHEAANVAGVEHVVDVSSMEEAVHKGFEIALAQHSPTVLLSPACSSFDWYSCFEERGEDFKRIVHSMVEGSESH